MKNNIFNKEKKYLFFIHAQFLEDEQNFNEAKLSYKNSILCDTFYFDAYINLLNLHKILVKRKSCGETFILKV